MMTATLSLLLLLVPSSALSELDFAAIAKLAGSLGVDNAARAEENAVAKNEEAVAKPRKLSELQVGSKISEASAQTWLFRSSDENSATRYGPGLCMKTWKNPSTGTCVVKTDCELASGFADYDMGFRCAKTDEEEAEVHLYGMGSFDRQETFDSKIPCEKCLHLEDKVLATAPSVDALSSKVANIRTTLNAVNASVSSLQGKLFSALQLRGAAKSA
eukprot:TRINITY_DN110233_c0_g1_i1.p1 TRINITY_DN110233_c0_g1~~TRINITY_DN110233_c0_g1_i1.p1  ORF type:complete len:234 (-),score=57.75 TRINITY_DN110233_c0_g1_i1:193-840(-)